MTTKAADHEPTAAATHEARRGFLTLSALFLAGPIIWISHFMAVYLLGEALCLAQPDTQLFGLPLLSTLTLVATLVAVSITALTTRWAYGRWRASGVGWMVSGPDGGLSEGGEQEGHLALAGWLMGLLFAIAILFVGLPAALLAC